MRRRWRYDGADDRADHGRERAGRIAIGERRG
jgi:hypothetical protein